MRVCPITKEAFSPTNDEHIFLSKEAFDTFLDEGNFIEKLPFKKEASSKSKERVCPNCFRSFFKTHNAIKFCNSCRKEKSQLSQTSTKEKRIPIFYYKPLSKSCKGCNANFLATTPAMKYCQSCRKN